MTYTKTSTLLQIDHVSLQYGDRIVLRDVHAEIKDIVRPDCVQGQVVAFLGPSGIGKSTLSRIIAGLQAPTSGAVMIDDRQSNLGTGGWERVSKGKVGYVPQNYPLFEFATVRGNLLVAGRQGGSDDAHARQQIDELVEALGLAEYTSLYPRQLSGGTRQRVAIARQMMCARHFLVLDEPFSGLDPIMKAKACALITKVANLDERNTIIIVTHDVTEGLSVADSVWLMGREPGQPGAQIVKEYDLAAEDLCWHPDILQDPRFQAFVGQVKADFASLT